MPVYGAICRGPLAFAEDFYVDRMHRRIHWGDLADTKKIELLRSFTRKVNILERAVWMAALELSCGNQRDTLDRFGKLIDAATEYDEQRRQELTE